MKTENEFFAALHSAEANPELGENLDLFGQFVGVWEFEWFGYEPNKDQNMKKVSGFFRGYLMDESYKICGLFLEETEEISKVYQKVNMVPLFDFITKIQKCGMLFGLVQLKTE